MKHLTTVLFRAKWLFTTLPGVLVLVAILGGTAAATAPVFNGNVFSDASQNQTGTAGYVGPVVVAQPTSQPTMQPGNPYVQAFVAADGGSGGLWNTCYNCGLNPSFPNHHYQVIWNNLDGDATAPDDIGIGPNALGGGSDTSTNGSTIAIGGGALERNTSGYYNIAIGRHALTQNTTGVDNVCVGLSCIGAVTTGTDNAAVGWNAMLGSNGSYDVSIGSGSMELATATADHNVAIGFNTGQNLANSGDTLVGSNSGVALTGSYNTAYGWQSLQNATTAQWNTVAGTDAGRGITTGTGNVLIGPRPDATPQNEVTTGSYNVSIGYDVAVPSQTANGQLDIQNAIYGCGNSATGTTVSSGGLSLFTQTCTTGFVTSAKPISSSANAGQISCSLSATTTCTASANIGAGFNHCVVSLDYASIGSQNQYYPLLEQYNNPNISAYVQTTTALTGTVKIDYVCM